MNVALTVALSVVVLALALVLLKKRATDAEAVVLRSDLEAAQKREAELARFEQISDAEQYANSLRAAAELAAGTLKDDADAYAQSQRIAGDGAVAVAHVQGSELLDAAKAVGLTRFRGQFY